MQLKTNAISTPDHWGAKIHGKEDHSCWDTGNGHRTGRTHLLSLVWGSSDSADGVELDVHPTRDRVLVVTHDRDLMRTLGVDITVRKVLTDY